jgi:hypothetical protein
MLSVRLVVKITKTSLLAKDSQRMSCFFFTIMPGRRATVAFAP